MKVTIRGAVLLAFAVAAVWWAFITRRAMEDRISLDVRNAELAEVVREMQNQTWERIWIEPGVAGKITLNIHKVPLEEALEMVAKQAEMQVSMIYPIYRNQSALRRLQALVSNGGKKGGTGWTNYADVMKEKVSMQFARKSGGSAMITFQTSGSSAVEAADALNRFTQGKLVLEDGITGLVSLDFVDVEMNEAAKKFGRNLGRKSVKVYVLKPYFTVDTKPPGEGRNQLP